MSKEIAGHGKESVNDVLLKVSMRELDAILLKNDNGLAEMAHGFILIPEIRLS